jgi:hypothetical protein
MANEVELSDEDVTYLLTLLRNASQPMTTQQLVEALRERLGGDDANR